MEAVVTEASGLFARFRAARAARRRERVEDALKHLFERQHDGRPATPESLAGALRVGSRARLQLQTQMESQGLIRTKAEGLVLTPAGEQTALHIVRAHRLWEHYLVTEARLPLDRVHQEAHRLEHRTAASRLDEMETSLGYPQRDPHGDPIPSRSGVLPPSPAGRPVTGWPPGQPGRIVHLEDEPPLAFAQILAEGLKLGQTVRVLEASPERYLLTDGEAEFRLAPAVAANVFLESLPAPSGRGPGAIPLSELRKGQEAQIADIDETCQGFTRRRFLDLGLTPGTEVWAELSNAFGDPRAYRIRGTLIALRNDQARMIWVRPEPAAAGEASHVR